MQNNHKRVKAVIAYDGTQYFGFQKQSSTSKTISSDIEKALHTLQIHTSIVGSGRTDAGVHASGQVIHFDLPYYWDDLQKLTLNLNRKLTHIRFKHIVFVDDDFHARFWAKKRLYRYVFKTRKPSIFEQNYISYYPNTFNTQALHNALHCFEGEHDFDFFRKTGTQTHTSVRTIYQAKYIQRHNYHYIYFLANGFLRAQVRMMTYAAMLHANNKLGIKEIREQLACREKYTTHLASEEGLYLAKVFY